MQRRSRTRFGLAGILVAGAALPLLGGSAAQADPQSDVTNAQAKLAALQDQAEIITEKWHGSQIALASAQAAEASAAQALARTKTAVAGQRSKVAAAASATYKAGALGQVAVFVGSSDPQAFLDRAADLGQVAHGRDADIAQLSSVVKQQSDAQAVLDHATAVADDTAKATTRDKQQVESLVAQQSTVLADAVAKQQEIVRQAQAAEAAADAAHKAAAAAAAERALELQATLQATQAAVAQPIVDDPAPAPDASSSDPTTATSDPTTATSDPAPTGSGVDAVMVAAEAQIGKPYVYGAAGPGSFDCSGLTMWAYSAAGVSLPHYTGAQYALGRHVTRAELQRGDLVFFGSDVHHVGLYEGNGIMLDAPHSGALVRKEPLFGDFVGGVRIFG